jgi:hypothetical protein
VDGTLETTGIEIAGMAELNIGVKKLSDTIEQSRLAHIADVAATPRYQRTTGVGNTGTGTGPITIEISGPEIGRFWLVRRVVIGAAQWASTAGGTAVGFITSVDSTQIGVAPQSLPTQDAFMSLAAMPAVTEFSNEQAYVHENENLVFYLYGTMTIATQYVVAVTFGDYPAAKIKPSQFTLG